MKQPKKLTRAEKEVLARHGLIASQWMLVEQFGSYLKVIHKDTGKIKLVDIFR